MTPLLLSGAIAAVVLLIAFVVLFWTLISTGRAQNSDEPVLPDLELDRYRPMSRLLSDEDIEFLRNQAGYTPKLERQLRSERRRVMRLYLDALTRDFGSIYRGATALLLTSPDDQPEFAGLLLRQKLEFSRAISMLRLNLYLDTVGIGQVNVQRVLEPFASLQDNYALLTAKVLVRQATL
jgi:hypothetical protein